jgi:hypothetical protein
MTSIQLPYLPVLDISNTCDKKSLPEFYFEIIKTKHKFSSDSSESGTAPLIPIFGCNCYVKYKCKLSQKGSTTFGLPILRVRQYQRYKTVMNNKSSYPINMHYHGL